MSRKLFCFSCWVGNRLAISFRAYLRIVPCLALCCAACARVGSPGGGPEDTIPPCVVRVAPEDSATRVSLRTNPRVEFSERMNKASADQANLSPQAFRYPGPMPHSREASLVFLSDAVEAAARSLAKVDKAALEGLIESVVNTRISDGQLTESQLTLREIGLVKEYFLTSLLSFYHVRDAYSSVEEANEKS